MRERSPLYGVIAEFDSPAALLVAARRARAAGYRRLTAYSPFPIDDLPEALGYSESTGIRPIVLVGGIVGALSGYLLQWWTSAVDYPINVGGRPYNSWQAFVPIVFELMVLFGALSALVGLFVLNGLPMPYHPVFNVPGFEGATRDRFFLCIQARDPRFDRDDARRFLATLDPLEVSDVPA
jgi:Protein of unknown function (DUF3341)